MVGYDLTPNRSAVALALGASASTFAMRTDGSEAKSAATCSQTGARDLQSGHNVISRLHLISDGSLSTHVHTTGR